MTKKTSSYNSANIPPQNEQDNQLELKEELTKYMATIKTDDALYEKTKKRINNTQGNNTTLSAKKRPVSFYFAIAASAACVILVGTFIFFNFDFFYMGRSMQDSEPAMANDSDEIFMIQESPPVGEGLIDAEQDDIFLTFEQQEQARDFFHQQQPDDVTAADVCESDQPDIGVSVSESPHTDEPMFGEQSFCLSDMDPYRYLSGSLLSQPKRSVLVDSESNLLFFSQNDQLIVWDVLDLNNATMLSSIDLQLNLEDENVSCASVDLLYMHDILWITYSYLGLATSQDSLDVNDQPLNFTRVARYDFSDPSAPEFIDTFDVEGRHLATEKNGNSVVVLSEKTISNLIYSEKNILPNTRAGSNDWTEIDVHRLAHIRTSPPRSFVLITSWSTDTDVLPQVYALSGSFNLFHLEANRLILFGSVDSEMTSIYAEWDQYNLYLGTQPNNISIIESN